MSDWKIFVKDEDGKRRFVMPKWARIGHFRDEKKARKWMAQLRMDGLRAGIRRVAQPAWKTHLRGDTRIPKNVSRQTKRNARRLRAKTGRAFKRAGKIGYVTSFVRTYAEQREMYEKYGPRRAARPGTSFHELGLAIDVRDPDGNTRDGKHLIEPFLRAEGLHTPLGNEDWHVTETNRWG